MVEVEDLAGVPGEKSEPGFCGAITIESEGCGFTVDCDRLAYDSWQTKEDYTTMLAMSATGGGTAVRSFRAALGVNHRVGFRFAPANGGGSTSMSRSEAGYDLFVRGIGLRCYHMVAISRRPGFLVSATPAALWQYLRKETTTPMDRRWLPAISAEMLNRGWIKRVNVAGSLASAVVAVDDAMMDECIVTLLSRGRVKIEG